MLRYLTVVDVFILSTLILKLRCLVIVFPLGMNNKISVFLVLRVILFDLSHWTRSAKSSATMVNYPRWQPEIWRKEKGEQRKQSSVHSVNTYKYLPIIKINNTRTLKNYHKIQVYITKYKAIWVKKFRNLLPNKLNPQRLKWK